MLGEDADVLVTITGEASQEHKAEETLSLDEDEDADAAAALYVSGVRFAFGCGETMNIKEAVRLYTLAAMGSSPCVPALVSLGVCLQTGGEGVPINLEEGARCFARAALNSPEAQHNLGVCYEHGHGVPVDQERAISLYVLAAEQGFAGANCALAHCYERGCGVSSDPWGGCSRLPKAVPGQCCDLP